LKACFRTPVIRGAKVARQNSALSASASRRRSGALSLGVAALAVFAPSAASAQIAPPNRTDLVPPTIRDRVERPTTLTIDGGFERAPCALDRAEYADIRFTLNGADFIGLNRVAGLSLDSAYQSYVGQDMPLSVLCDIRAKANADLRSQGYLATVEIPEQNLRDGVPDFRVVFGRLTSVRVRGDAGPSEQTAARYLEKLTQQDVFNTNMAERYLLLADDLPGINVRLSLRPAANGDPGDLIGEIAVVRQKGVAFLNIQNFGSSAIGPFGASAQGEIYDITGLGDRTSFTAFSTIDFTEQQTFRLAHDFAVGGEGLRIGGSLTYSTTNPDVNLANIDVDSESFIASGFASFPLERTRAMSVYAETGFDIVNQNVEANNVRLTVDRVRTAYVRVTGEHIDENSIRRLDGYTAFEPKFQLLYGAEVRKGFDVLDASPDCRPNLLACTIGGAIPPGRIEADPTPFLFRANANAAYRPSPEWTLAANVQGQFSSSPLPAFEEFAAGSFSIGRGYDPGAVLGDSGIAAAFEVRYGSLAPKSADSYAYQPYVFTDVAFAWNEDPSRRALNPDRLWSAGAGVRGAFGSKLQGDLMIAVPIERPDLAATRGDVRVMFSLTALLFPWRY